MPTYVYRREDGSTFECIQRMSEDALDVCPDTNQKVRRVISGGTGFILKGSGFYKTDYASNGAKSEGSEGTVATEAKDTGSAQGKEPEKAAAKKDAD